MNDSTFINDVRTMTTQADNLRLYDELASWWELFSPPSHYVEEARDLGPQLLAAADPPARTLLELGAGAGSLAFHLKGSLALTLTDRSPQMLEVSKRVNPECTHLLGDMRTLDLGQTFDLVLVHDAIMYAIDPPSLRATIATAFRHLRPGGGAVFVPDFVRETFEPETTTGGEDAPSGRGLRYLQWTYDTDPTDRTYETAWAFLLRDANGCVRVDRDFHTLGLFPRSDWLTWIRDAGLEVRSRQDPWGRDVFVARKPGAQTTRPS